MTDTRPTPGPRHAPHSRLSSLGWRKLGMFLLLLAVAIFFSILLGEKLAERTATANKAQDAGVANGRLAIAGQNLARQVHDECQSKGVVARQLGALCPQASSVAAASPSPVPGVDKTIIPGPQGIPGIPGPSGPSGASGAVGIGIRGAIGPVGPVGPGGPGGAGGPAGQAGTGVAGSPGAAGSPGGAGPSGPVGPSGASGASGSNGVDGQPPQAFTFTYVDTLGVTRTETCRRNVPFDPAQPQYTCEVTP